MLKTLNDDVILVNEAFSEAHRPGWIIEATRTHRFRNLLKQVCEAYYRLNRQLASATKAASDLDHSNRSDEIEMRQRLAGILVRHCEDKDNPPYQHTDGAYATGLKSVRMLIVELGERVDEIVKFREVMARKMLEEREEHEKKLADLRDLIKLKDDALLAAAERIKGQSEALTAAAGRAVSYRRPCEYIHLPYSGQCEHCQPPSEQDLFDQTDLGASDDRPLGPDHPAYRK